MKKAALQFSPSVHGNLPINNYHPLCVRIVP